VKKAVDGAESKARYQAYTRVDAREKGGRWCGSEAKFKQTRVTLNYSNVGYQLP
jgi:hypothetical protein